MRTTVMDEPATKSEGTSAGTERDSASQCVVDLRSQPRFPVTAAATAVEETTGARIDARTTDLAVKGCYVDTMNPFPTGTAIQLRLTKGGSSFRAQAKVMYCHPGMGMGLLFTAAAPEQLLTLEKWIKEVRGEGPVETHGPEDERVWPGKRLKDEERYALEELLIVLMRKDLLTQEEGEPILRRLTWSEPIA
jgi:hypothetical protein